MPLRGGNRHSPRQPRYILAMEVGSRTSTSVADATLRFKREGSAELVCDEDQVIGVHHLREGSSPARPVDCQANRHASVVEIWSSGEDVAKCCDG